MTSGNSASFADILRVLTNPGDYILMENYTFVTAIQFVKSYGLKIIPLVMDEEGIEPCQFEDQLKKWHSNLLHCNGGRTPILYTIP